MASEQTKLTLEHLWEGALHFSKICPPVSQSLMHKLQKMCHALGIDISSLTTQPVCRKCFAILVCENCTVRVNKRNRASPVVKKQKRRQKKMMASLSEELGHSNREKLAKRDVLQSRVANQVVYHCKLCDCVTCFTGNTMEHVQRKRAQNAYLQAEKRQNTSIALTQPPIVISTPIVRNPSSNSNSTPSSTSKSTQTRFSFSKMLQNAKLDQSRIPANFLSSTGSSKKRKEPGSLEKMAKSTISKMENKFLERVEPKETKQTPILTSTPKMKSKKRKTDSKEKSDPKGKVKVNLMNFLQSLD